LGSSHSFLPKHVQQLDKKSNLQRMKKCHKYALVTCDDNPKWADIPPRLFNLFGDPQDKWEVFDATKQQLPDLENISQYNGMMLLGSRASVSDRLKVEWIGKYLDWIKKLNSLGLDKPKVVASCFSCQAVAHALGGKSGKNPSGHFVLKAEDIHFLDKFRQYFETDKKSVTILESHGDCVLELPNPTEIHREVEILASSPTASIEIFLIGKQLLAIQGHPEFIIPDVTDKILPTLLSNKLLSEENKNETLKSFEKPLNHQEMIQIMKKFLQGGFPK